MLEPKKYKAYSLHNFLQIPQLTRLSSDEKLDIEVVGNVLPFKVNNYVIDELIDWDNYLSDPMFKLTFPQKGMLTDKDFLRVRKLLQEKVDKETLKKEVNKIRLKLNPHPANQQDNVPEVDGIKLTGIQHKYRETILFFPSQGQTCHAYCSFCFRWPQFVGMDDMKFAMKETELLVRYLQEHPEVTDIIFTGGDPMIMSPKVFNKYIDALLAADIPTLKNIRIGTKSLSFWPYKYVTDSGAEDMLSKFREVQKSGSTLRLWHISITRKN